jgi:hypothetical protein
MEPEGSLLHSLLPATCLYPETAQPSPYPHIPLPEDQNPVRASPLPLHATRPAHLILLDFITCHIYITRTNDKYWLPNVLSDLPAAQRHVLATLCIGAAYMLQ